MPAELDQRFRARAYEMVLRELGTSSEEVRLSRTADDATRQSLANRLGIGLEGSRPDRLDAITIAPDEITDSELEQLFGYRSTNPSDPLAIPEPALVSLWQHDALRAAWLRADNEQRDGADGPLPVIDPDVIVETHIRNDDPEDTAHRIWLQRRAWIDEQLVDIADVLEQVGPTPDTFDAALAEAGLTIDLVALAEQDEDGVDITAELAGPRAHAGGVPLPRAGSRPRGGEHGGRERVARRRIDPRPGPQTARRSASGGWRSARTASCCSRARSWPSSPTIR